jgi:two-component sensor histidine kinase/putative methionine-R-sulfoxide reductase with GAF domain
VTKRDSHKPDPALAKMLEYQRALSAFSRIASGELPLGRLMHHATAQVARATQVKRVKVMRYRPDRGDLLIEAGVGWKPGVVGTVTLGTDRASPPGHTLQTAAPLVVEDLPNDPHYRYSSVLQDHGIVSVLNVPVMIDGKTWGVLEVDADQPQTFDDSDVGFLTTLANILGMAIRRHEADQRALATADKHARELAHAKVLMRELQHRVKNNFQVILSFMSLQSRRASEEVGERLQAVMDRVQAIALAHDQLSPTEGGSEVDFGDYLQALCSNIDPKREGVSIEVETCRATLPLDRAVPAGLIINELVTNSFKYAFDEEGGAIRVACTFDGDIGECSIVVEDDGKGMGQARPGGLGLTLVQAFANQLGGGIEHHQVQKGTRIEVRFPTVIDAPANSTS